MTTLGALQKENEMQEEEKDLLQPCSAAHCIMAPERPRKGMYTQGGCRHLKFRGPELNKFLRTMANEIHRLRAAKE